MGTAKKRAQQQQSIQSSRLQVYTHTHTHMTIIILLMGAKNTRPTHNIKKRACVRLSVSAFAFSFFELSMQLCC